MVRAAFETTVSSPFSVVTVVSNKAKVDRNVLGRACVEVDFDVLYGTREHLVKRVIIMIVVLVILILISGGFTIAMRK